MLGLIEEKAKHRDLEALRTLEILRAIGVIQKESETTKEPMAWEILDQCRCGSKRYRKKRWTTN